MAIRMISGMQVFLGVVTLVVATPLVACSQRVSDRFCAALSENAQSEQDLAYIRSWAATAIDEPSFQETFGPAWRVAAADTPDAFEKSGLDWTHLGLESNIGSIEFYEDRDRSRDSADKPVFYAVAIGQLRSRLIVGLEPLDTLQRVGVPDSSMAQTIEDFGDRILACSD